MRIKWILLVQRVVSHWGQSGKKTPEKKKKPTVQKLQPIGEGKTSSSGDIPFENWSIDLFEPPNVERGTTVRGARDSPTCIVKAVKSKNTFPRVLQNLKHRHPSQEDSSVSVYKWAAVSECALCFFTPNVYLEIVVSLTILHRHRRVTGTKTGS